jgi:signal transduction histidine kinase
MKVRTKSIVSITVLTLVVFLGVHVFSEYLLLPSLDEVDKKNAENNLIQVAKALNHNTENMQALLIDYANWDDTYNFVQNSNQQYIDSNFVDGTFKNLKLNFIAIIDNNRNVLYSQFYNLSTSTKIPTPNEVNNILQSDDTIFSESISNTTVSGLLLIDNQPMLLSSAPILTSLYQGPTMGRMIFGQYIDNYQINQLEDILSFNFSIVPLGDFQLKNNQVFQTLQSNIQTSAVENNNPNSISAYMFLNDINSNRTFVLQITNERVGYQEGQILQVVLFGGSLVLSFVIATSFFVLFETAVVRPMNRLAANVKAISFNGKKLDKTDNMGSDELNIVSAAVKDTIDKKFEAMLDVSTMVAHDLRNPLAGIKNAVYVLNKNYAKGMDDKGKSMLATIRECVDYSDKIVIDLLDFSTEFKLDKVITSPKELLDSVLSQFILPNNIHVVNMTDDNCFIVIDKNKIIRVFYNLIKNAFDAMPTGGELVISNKKLKDKVVVDFSDSGTGMSKEVIAKLWTPFFTTKAKGMGMGLPICKKIVELHGGKIEVASTLNKGTTFSVYLPTHT